MEEAVQPGQQDESDELSRLREELQRERDMHLRTLADFDNYRKRVERDRASSAQTGKREIILSLLNVVDNFERALSHADNEPSALVEGLRAIYKQLLGILEAQGVTAFSSLGEPFDPNRHEAISAVASDEHESGMVYDEFQRGYMWGNELLRPARVRVVE